MFRNSISARLGIAISCLCAVACGGKATITADTGAAAGGSSASSNGGTGIFTVGGTSSAAAGSSAVGGATTTSGGGVSGQVNAGGAPSTGVGGASTGVAGASTGVAGAPPNPTSPSCVALANTCGPKGNADCCAANLVPGGSYNRTVNGQTFETTVSNFTLDTYEVTVGRFRKFVAAYAQNMIPAGAGKNPHNPADPGWDPSWNASLDVNAAALKAALVCDTSATWTDAPGSAASENRPINCLSWFEAEAFCTWDNGRLPTDAEWDYVTFAGPELRHYPWGNTEPDCTFANFFGAAGGTLACVDPPDGAPNVVGSESPKGDSKWGQADMSGNVDEWLQDWTRLDTSPCNDCAAVIQNGSTRRGIRGGSFGENAGILVSNFRTSGPPAVHVELFGARCARAAR